MRCILPLVASIVVTTAASPFAADNTFDAETNSKGNPGSIIGATIESSSNEASLDSVSDTDPESILPSESTGVPEVLGVSSVEADETLVTNGNIPATTSTSQSNHISVISDCSDPRVKSPAKRNKRRWWWDSPSLCPVPVPEAPETSEVPAAKPDTPAKKGGLPTQLIPPKQIVPQQDVPSKTEFPFTTPQENPGLCPVILTSPLCCSAIPADYGSFVTDCKIFNPTEGCQWTIYCCFGFKRYLGNPDTGIGWACTWEYGIPIPGQTPQTPGPDPDPDPDPDRNHVPS